jgi:rhodanese-related sulfurtransferase
LLLDVREKNEITPAVLGFATNIPLGELPLRLGELPRDREIIVYCRRGERAAIAHQILRQNGFTARYVNEVVRVGKDGSLE